MLEALPPYDQQGDDELSWIIPEIEKDQTLVYRITNTAQPSARRGRFDFASSPHNLIPNAGFERAGTSGQRAAGWDGDGELDAAVKRSGLSSLRLRGTKEQRVRLAGGIPLHRGSRYYFGIWGKTHEVEGRGFHLEGPARKLIAHILVHEIRHWAQIALAVRLAGLEPPGDHDLFYSNAMK